MSEKVLELKHVNAYYRENGQRKQILKDVTFSIYEEILWDWWEPAEVENPPCVRRSWTFERI